MIHEELSRASTRPTRIISTVAFCIWLQRFCLAIVVSEVVTQSCVPVCLVRVSGDLTMLAEVLNMIDCSSTFTLEDLVGLRVLKLGSGLPSRTAYAACDL